MLDGNGRRFEEIAAEAVATQNAEREAGRSSRLYAADLRPGRRR
jgi:hypothetical protein